MPIWICRIVTPIWPRLLIMVSTIHCSAIDLRCITCHPTHREFTSCTPEIHGHGSAVTMHTVEV